MEARTDEPPTHAPPAAPIPAAAEAPIPAAEARQPDPVRIRETLIVAGRTESEYWSDVWRYRELLLFLALRDILVRYKQTAIGVAWAVLRPLLTMAAFTVVFGGIAKLPSGGIPYPVLVFAGLLPWQLFANALSESGNSLVANANLISKIYFPRLIIPAAAALAGLADFLISLALLAAMMLWYGLWPTWRIAALPVFVLLALAASLGMGIWLAALTVKYRDFRYVVPFLIQFGLYLSPVGFSSDVIPGEWRLLYSLNPLVGVIDGFRWCLVGGEAELDLPGLALSAGLTAALLAAAILHFRRTERTFADII